MKRKNLFTTLPVLLLTTVLLAQTERPNKEKIKELQIGYFTQKLNLSTEEAQAFWPVFNAFGNEMEEIRKERKKHKKMR